MVLRVYPPAMKAKALCLSGAYLLSGYCARARHFCENLQATNFFLKLVAQLRN